MNIKHAKTFLSRALLVSSIALLPACTIGDWFKGSSSCVNCDHGHGDVTDASEAVVSFAGKTIVSPTDFEKSIDILSAAQPGFKEMLPYMSEEQQDQIYEQIAEHLAAERVMQEWLKRSGIDKTAEFKENARQVHEAVDRDLAVRAFENDLARRIQITDEEAEAFYNEHKDSLPIFKHPQFITSVGGTRARSINAANEKEAKDLVERAKKEGFEKVANDTKKSVNDLGVVTMQSASVDADVRSKILAAKNVPDIIVVKSSKGQWQVVELPSQQPAQHADFAQVSDKVKQVMMRDKFTELYKKEMDELKKEFDVVVNKEYLKKRKKTVAPADIENQAEELVADEQAEHPASVTTHAA